MTFQWGFDFSSGIGFDTGHGQADFGFDGSQHSRDERERRKRHAEEEFARQKRKREEWKREEQRQREQQERAKREREEQARQERARSARSGCPWESPHDVLGVKFGATAAEIRRAWAAKMKTCHPDLGGNVSEAQRYNRAYEALKGRK